jgi:hypothetical protein
LIDFSKVTFSLQTMDGDISGYSLSGRRPFPGQGPQVTNSKPIVRERPSPGSSLSRPHIINRSIKPEWNDSPSPAMKKEAISPLPSKKLGTPEGLPSEVQQLPSPARLRPSPEVPKSDSTEGTLSKKMDRSRPPSPGMGSTLSKRPSSPDIGSVTRVVPPSPGRSSPAPPNRVDYSTQSSVDNNEADRKPPERQKSVRFDESPPRKRFIFSPNPSEKASIPSRINVSSTTSRRLPAPEASESIPNLETDQSTVETIPEPQASPIRNKKNDNPLRNNPLFLQKMAEAAESDSEDDEELQIYNAKERNTDSNQMKLTGMAKMKKLAELSSIKDMSPLPLKGNDDCGTMLETHVKNNGDDNDIVNSDDDEYTLERPVTFLDGPRLNTESNTKSKNGLQDDHKCIAPVTNATDKFADAPKHWAKVNQNSPSRRKILEGMKNSPNKQSLSTSEKHENQNIPIIPASISSNSSTSPEKIMPASSMEKAVDDSPGRAAEDKAASLTNEERKLGNEESSDVTKLSVDISKKMTIAEKLEKRKLSRVPVRQQSNSSAVSTDSKSTKSIGKSRREMLDKVKGRISRSPSPSPLIQRHMAPPKVMLEKKTAMQKLIEARQKKSGKQFEKNVGAASSNSSYQSRGNRMMNAIDFKVQSKDRSNSPRQLRSVSSIVSAPSDEKGVTIGITNSASSEHLSVQKGLYLVQKQNAAMKQLHQPRIKVNQKDSHFEKKSAHALPEVRATSQETKVDSFKVDMRTNSTSEIAVKYSSSVNEEEYTPSKAQSAPQDDDNFSIDEFPEELSPSPSPSDQKNSRKSNRQSKWAEVMEDRLQRSNEDSNYFDDSDDNYDGGSWSSDDGRKKQDMTSNTKIHVFHKKGKALQKPAIFSHKSKSFLSREEQIQQSLSISDSFPLKEKESSRTENLFEGAYAELLPRSTNPLVVRTCKPTLPSSLISMQRRPLYVSEHVSETSDVWYTSLDTQLKETKEFTNYSHVPEYNTEDQDVRPSSNSDHFKEPLVTEEKSDVSEKLTQQSSRQPYSPNHSFVDSNEDKSSPNDSKRKNVPFESANHSVGNIKQQLPQGEDSSCLQDSLVESTLIGQFHVDSGDIESDACIQNQSIAEWWDKSYAHTQDDEVNSDIKQALSNSKDSISLSEMKKNAGDDSDDDVFYGLDEGSPSSKERMAKHLRDKHEIGVNNLDPILSQDDSDFEMIMNGEITPSPKHKKDAFSPPSSSHSTSTDTPFKNKREKKGRASKEISKANVTEQMNKKNEVKKSDTKMNKENEVTKSDTKQHIKHPQLNSKPRKPSKAHRSRKTNECKNLDASTIGDGSVDEGTSGEESYDDSGTYDDTHDGNRSVSSKSSMSGGSYTLGSDTFESMSLSERERRKWSDWDKKDHDTTFSGDTRGHSEISTEQLAVMERRARSHESLLLHAYTALSKPPPTKMVEKGSVQHPTLASSGSTQYYSDGENQLPGKGTHSPEAYQKHKLEMDRFFV